MVTREVQTDHWSADLAVRCEQIRIACAANLAPDQPVGHMAPADAAMAGRLLGLVDLLAQTLGEHIEASRS